MNRSNVLVSMCALVVLVGITAAATDRAPVAISPSIHPVLGDGTRGPANMAWVPGRDFLMGSDSKLSQPNERPTHTVRISGFWMDTHDVTNAEFRHFVDETGYVTTAERRPRWNDLKAQLPPGTPQPHDDALVPGAMVFVGTTTEVSLRDYSQWWRFVPGANWRHPIGPDDSIASKDNYPVVQVSYEDAQAYAKWAGKRLPTESEWELAARGGLEQANYAWGDDASRAGKSMANTWDSRQSRPFPVVTEEKMSVGTTPVGSYAPNGYGLYDMAGNVWQWTADWYRADAFAFEAKQGGLPVDPIGPAKSFDPDEPGVPVYAPKRVIRGGSFLCSDAYCISYRTSARRGTDPMNSMSHLGFRTVMSEKQWKIVQARQPIVASR